MADDPMEQVVGRVGGAVSRLRAIGMMFDTAVGDADAIDSLLAAYQSVRSERDRERSRADNLYATILDWDRQ